MLNAGELRNEVADRGYHHIGTTRVALFVDQAALEVYTDAFWSFRRSSLSGVSGSLTFPVGTVVKHAAKADGTRLWPISESGSLDENEQGQDSNEYYVEGGTTFRISDGTATNVNLVVLDCIPWAGGNQRAIDANDTMKIPGEYEDIVIELAVAKAAADDGRLEDEATARGTVKARLEEMHEMFREGDEPKVVKPWGVW